MSKIKLTYELPDKLSDLLTQALNDLEKVEKMGGYQIDMGAWHVTRGEERVCHVCLAGAALVGLGFPKELNYADTELDPETERKLDALNMLRLGMVDDAACAARVTPPSKPLTRDITGYDTNPEKFKNELRQLAADLKEAGL